MLLNIKTTISMAAAALLMAYVPASRAQNAYTENFTGTSTVNSWYFINGACLTMGTPSTSTASNPACNGSAYYASKYDPLLGGNSGSMPDTVSGALRFTGWYNENGAILSNFNFPLSTAGLQVSFTTVTYEGDSGGGGHDGADGISFFLQDATYPADVGAFGGSLGYTCSNNNNDGVLRGSGIPRGYDGLAGGYFGLGIDEYGNFANPGDNTVSGPGYIPGRINTRGPGNVTWASLNAAYPVQYPSSLSNGNKANAVRYVCYTGRFQDWSQVAANTATNPSAYTPAVPLPDYGYFVGKTLPTNQPIAVEYPTATRRNQATPITYNLKITTDGLLSLSYSYNGGANQNVISSQDITQKGAYPLPANIRFGFAGSTGGSTNIHEVMCFQATPTVTSQSSAGINQKQTAKVQIGTQVYFAYYNPATLAGSLTSQYLDASGTNGNVLTIDPVINWDGSCVLTGGTGSCDGTGPALTAPPSPASRVIFSWNGTTGVPFEYTSSPTSTTLTGAQLSALDAGDSTSANPPPSADARLQYLRGDRSNEQTPTAFSAVTYSGVFRDRASVLGDIIDSSPTWVGPPSSGYPAVWLDKLPSAALHDPLPENTGTSYATFASSGTVAAGHEQQRTNVVYAGANDGMLHGFRTGSYDAGGNYVKANNDGKEVMAYMPGYVVSNIQNAGNPSVDFSDPLYGHKFDVDAPPGTGDLFYNGMWHTWLIGGLSGGGPAIYALDITDPDSNFLAETNANSTVIGEWTNATISCANTSCGSSLGNTWGVPQIRRFHNGTWGAVFGNGFGSSSGDAGIFVMLVSQTGTTSFYYLSTGTSGTSNGIAYATPADLDGDHITDYVYAGDLLGNVWRFDLTSSNPANWAVVSTPVYTNATGNPRSASNQPITSKVSVVSVLVTSTPRILVEFGSGRQIPTNNVRAATYSQNPQTIYGIWDWNLSAWNGLSTAQYAVMSSGTAVSGTAKLQVQTITSTQAATTTGTGTDYRTVSSNAVCWADVSGCTEYGWYLNMVSGNAYSADPAVPQNGNPQYANNPLVYEQVIFSPTVQDGAFIVNTTIPPTTAATMCFSSAASGWTMALDPATGGAFTTAFFDDTNLNFLTVNVTSTNASGATVTTVPVSGIAVGGTGSVSVVQSGNQNYMITQTVNGTGFIDGINPVGNMKGNRITWTEKR